MPPDALLPYQRLTTASILRLLDHVIIEGVGTMKASETFLVPRTTLRRLLAKFRETVKILRLPGRAGALNAPEFLPRLFALGVDGIADLFADWKQFESKLSLVGSYPR